MPWSGHGLAQCLEERLMVKRVVRKSIKPQPLSPNWANPEIKIEDDPTVAHQNCGNNRYTSNLQVNLLRPIYDLPGRRLTPLYDDFDVVPPLASYV